MHDFQFESDRERERRERITAERRAYRKKKRLNLRWCLWCYTLALLCGAGTAFSDDWTQGAVGILLAAFGAGFLDLAFIEALWGPGGSRVGDPL